MTWLTIGSTAVTVVSGAVSADQNRKASNKAADKLSNAQRDAQALNEQRYQEARSTLSPYLNSSAAANKQLMIEMGLGGQYAAAEQDQRKSRLVDLQNQLAQLQSAQTAQSAQSAQSKTKKKRRGGLLGAIQSVAEKSVIGSLLHSSTTSNTPAAPSAVDRSSQIQSLQEQIAQEQAAYDKYSAEPTQSQQPGTAYMNTPVYQGAIKAGTDAVNTGAAGSGALYSGARGVSLKDVGQNVNQSMYSNYMNILQNIANPAAATNLSNIGINQAGNLGQQNIAATGVRNNYALQNATDQGAFISDAAGGLSSAFTAYMNRPKTPKVSPVGTQAGEATFNPGLT